MGQGPGVLFRGRTFIVPRHRVIEVAFDLFMALALVAFEREHIFGVGLFDFLATCFWQPRASSVTMQPESSSARKSCGTAVISLVLPGTSI